MAGNVSVEVASIRKGIACCTQSIQKLDDAAKKLNNSYQQAGSEGWKDQKYAAVGGIVGGCTSALKKPIEELASCKAKLNELLKAVSEYENINF